MEALIISVIWFLIGAAVVGGLIYLIFYVIGKVSGQPVPPKVAQIIWILYLLICLLILVVRIWPIASKLAH